jgi:hypothetical protein
MMAFLFRPVRLLPVIRQLALVAMLLVQATIVASPLFEPHSTGAPVTHVEEPGTRHVDMHNEETCVVCSVRAMHVVITTPAAAIATVLEAGTTLSTEVPRLSLHAALALYPSRAPPV